VGTIQEPRGNEAESGVEDGVFDWRLAELISAGYESHQALLLARRVEVDLHLATDLPRRGCPHKTALRILL
jgi:hypothetical protein